MQASLSHNPNKTKIEAKTGEGGAGSGAHSCVSSSERMKRILTAIVLIVLVGLLIFLGKLWMVTLFAAVVALLASLEFRQLSAAGGNPIPLWWTIFAIILFFLATFLLPQDTITAVVFSTLLLFAWNTFRTPLARVLQETAAGPLMLIYIAYPLTLIPLIWSRAEGDGLVLVIFLFLCVWSGDIAALYIGKRFGRRKLAPELSPTRPGKEPSPRSSPPSSSASDSSSTATGSRSTVPASPASTPTLRCGSGSSSPCCSTPPPSSATSSSPR